jgi:hypothetical protein
MEDCMPAIAPVPIAAPRRALPDGFEIGATCVNLVHCGPPDFWTAQAYLELVVVQSIRQLPRTGWRIKAQRVVFFSASVWPSSPGEPECMVTRPYYKNKKTSGEIPVCEPDLFTRLPGVCSTHHGALFSAVALGAAAHWLVWLGEGFQQALFWSRPRGKHQQRVSVLLRTALAKLRRALCSAIDNGALSCSIILPQVVSELAVSYLGIELNSEDRINLGAMAARAGALTSDDDG